MARDRTFSHHKVTIAINGTVSGSIPVGAETIVAISTASAGASWVAAVLGFEWTPDDGTTWLPVFDDGATEVTIASATVATASARILVNATIIAKLAALSGRVRLASGPSAARVAQTNAAQSFDIICKTP